MKKVLISHTVGNSNTRGAVYGLKKSGLLHSFHICVAVFKSSWYYKYLGHGILQMFLKRTFSDEIKQLTYCYPFRELGRQISQVLGLKELISGEKSIFSTYRICQQIDEAASKTVSSRFGELAAVYCYEDTAIKTFKEAKKHHVKCLYDLPIGYWRAMVDLLSREAEKNPDWAITLGGINDSDFKHETKDSELKLADHILVASAFTKKTLEMYPGKLAEISVVPYGFPAINHKRVYQSFENRKIKVLYVGGLSQRKGISYLFEAVKGLENQILLSVVGTGNISGCPALKEALSKCNYLGTMPHEKVLKVMAENDVMIFPSLFEGFGLVITEAMSQGTPVVTTDRTCGPDIITHGKDGWIVEAGSSSPIRKLLLGFISNPLVLQMVGKEAMNTASKRPWIKYEEEVADCVSHFIGSK